MWQSLSKALKLTNKPLTHLSQFYNSNNNKSKNIIYNLTILDGDVPKRVWTRKDVSYKHLRMFSCRAYVHIPKDERSKLDNKAKEYIFLGFGHEEFGYRLCDLVARKFITSRDVVFLEDRIVFMQRRMMSLSHL